MVNVHVKRKFEKTAGWLTVAKRLIFYLSAADAAALVCFKTVKNSKLGWGALDYCCNEGRENIDQTTTVQEVGDTTFRATCIWGAVKQTKYLGERGRPLGIAHLVLLPTYIPGVHV